MKHAVRILLVAILLTLGVAVIPALSQGTAKADSPKPAAKPNVGTIVTVGMAYLKPDYVNAVGPAQFLDGNKLVGELVGIDNGFASFKRKGSPEMIYIPTSAILYMTGKERGFIF